MTGGLRWYRDLTPADRAHAVDAHGDLLAVARAARRDGWLPHERDPVIAAARSRGVFVWRALVDRINAEAARLEASP